MKVLIRPYRIDDIHALFEAATESVTEVEPFLPWCHAEYSLNESRTWVELQIAQFQAGKEFQFAVISSGDNSFLGGCGLNTIDHAHRWANLGYWVRSSATRQGVATEAVRELTHWAFENTNLNRLEIVASTHNTASLRVAEKAGAMREGTLRNRFFLRGVAHDAVVFSLAREDFEKRFKRG
jgi:RimJ/RimL family protein N-acetyltransferase